MSNGRDDNAPLVVLVHGLWRTEASMRILSMRLRAAGFRTGYASYASRHMRVEEAVETVTRQIERMGAQGDIHLVGHSLGGIVALRVKHERQDLQVKRVVQLGSPNRGSAAARTLRDVRLAREFFGPVLTQLADDPGGDGAPNPDVMAVAGAAMPRWLAQRYGMRGLNDGLVSVRSAWGWAAGKRRRVDSMHGWLPLSAEVAEDVIAFLKTGDIPPEVPE